jgi:hypothetical protein
MRYNVDEEPPCSNLSIFALRGTTIGNSTSYYSTSEERKAALLYMYANIDGMGKYFESVCCTSMLINTFLSCFVKSKSNFLPYSEFQK